MEPPHSDAAYASSLQSVQTWVEWLTWSNGECETIKLKPKPELPMTASVVNQPSRHPVLEHEAGKCKFLQTCTLAVKGA